MSESDDFQARLLNMKDVGDTRDYDIGYENGRWWAMRKATASDLAALETMCRNGDSEYHIDDMYQALYGVEPIKDIDVARPEDIVWTEERQQQESIMDYLTDMVTMGPDNGWGDTPMSGASFAMVKGFLEAVLQVKAERAAKGGA